MIGLIQKILRKQSIIIVFVSCIIVIGTIRWDKLQERNSLYNTKRLLFQSTGEEACQYVNFEIDRSTIKTKGTTSAFDYLHSVRPKNKLITALESNSTDDWNSYIISLIPLFLPFFVVSIFCFVIWIICISQVVFKSCFKCCDRDIYRNPYSQKSIFWCMLVTIIFFILCTMVAIVSIIQIEMTYKGYQQLRCQGYYIFDNFMKGSNGETNWIGIQGFGAKIESVQNLIKKDTYEKQFLQQLIDIKRKVSSELDALQDLIKKLFDDLIKEQINDPSYGIDPSSGSAEKIDIDKILALNNLRGLQFLKDQLELDKTSITYIAQLFGNLIDQSDKLFKNIPDNNKLITEKKQLIDAFTKSFEYAQSKANGLFDQGNRYLQWYRVGLLIFLGIILFCCLTTFIFFTLIYYKKIKCLEHFLNFIWGITALVANLGFFAAGIVYTTTIIFYEGSLSLDSFLTSQESYNKMSYILDQDAAKITSECIFQQSVSIGKIFELEPYLENVNFVSIYMTQIQTAFGGRDYPNLNINDQIYDVLQYIQDLEQFDEKQVNLRFQKFKDCVKKNTCGLNDTFVFNRQKCDSDGKKRFILIKGQEKEYLDLENCIIINTVKYTNDPKDDKDNKMNYKTRLEEKKDCSGYESCIKAHLPYLITYADQSGNFLQKIMQKLKEAKNKFVEIYQNYRNYYKNIKKSYEDLQLKSNFDLISDEKKGIFKNTECTTFGTNLKTMHRYLSNQFIFEVYTLDWWTISTFVGMIAGLFFMYFTISRLQFWANFDGQQIEEEQQNENTKSPEKPLIEIQSARTLKVQNKNNSSILNDSQLLKSKLLPQSAYQKKYTGGFRQSNLSTSNFQYQVTLNESNQYDSPSKLIPPQNMTTNQYQTQTKSKYDIEMENYYS